MCKEENHETGEIPSRPGTYIATARVPGACGELWQGTLDGEQPALVTCPIDWYSLVSLTKASGLILAGLDDKARKALYAFRRGVFGVSASLMSTIPQAKGMGSSTADISAVIYAAARFYEEELSPREVAEIAISIEPSDSLMFPGLALFDHRGGKIYEDLTPKLFPDIGIIVLGFPGEVDTLAYNADYQSEKLREMRIDHAEALYAVKCGLRHNRPEDIGYGATLSARTHQRILYKPYLETVIELSRSFAIGVCAAHSGTVLGVLVKRGFFDLQSIANYLNKKLNLEFVSVNRMVGGGPRYD